MATQEEVVAAIARIIEMEVLFDELLQAYDTMTPAELNAPAVQALIQSLHRYYSGGEWMNDHALDEADEIPKTLKRGVLSEDGLYNLLCDVEDALECQ